MREELFEEGIVIKSGGGIAEIILKENNSCEECSAKIFCNPQKDNLRTLKVIDSFATQPGDEVRISVSGNDILKASVLLYGLPLILLIGGIVLGMSLFANSYYKELYGFLTGITFLSVYFALFYIISPKTSRSKSLPRIVHAANRIKF